MTVAFMRDFSPREREDMRSLSYGNIPWGFYQWTYHDGSTWASTKRVNGILVSWASITRQIDVYPVIGAYTLKQCRGEGYSEEVVTNLLDGCTSLGILNPGDKVYACSYLWDKYPSLIAKSGLIHVEWE